MSRDDEAIKYVFTYKIEAEATSFDYGGKDDDTKEIIMIPSGSHTFEGKIEVEVDREADMYLDFEADKGFESACIISGCLEEVHYEPIFDDEYEEEYIYGGYTICPDCGKKIGLENDGGNGFCIECAPYH